MNYQITGRIKPFRRRTVVFAAAAFAFLLAGCGIWQAQDDQFATQVAVASTEINQTIVADWTLTPTETPVSTETATPTLTPTITEIAGTATPDERPLAENWQSWPIVPEISDTAKRIFRQGVDEFGTNPRVFSEASQKASPNLAPGTALTMALWISSTVLMKCDMPRIIFRLPGFFIVTRENSIGILL